MAWFNKKRDVIDLTEHYRKKQEKLAAMREDMASNSGSSSDSSTSAVPGFGIFGMGAGSSSSSNSSSGVTTYGSSDSSSDSSDEKRKKLAKRLMAMTDKIEDLSNQIYHLQQRIEVLERKSPSGF